MSEENLSDELIRKYGLEAASAAEARLDEIHLDLLLKGKAEVPELGLVIEFEQ